MSITDTDIYRYVEAIDVLYSENILSFRQTRTIVDLERTILPQRLDRIRSVRLSFPLELFTIDAEGQELATGAWEYPLDIPYFWDAAWKILARMESLESLQVEFTLWRMYHGPDPELNALLHLLRPMTVVHVPRYVVDLYLDLDTDALMRALDALPFEIRVRERIDSFEWP